ncbi:MAG: hypothetical protein Q8W46_13105 [Candidatus Palauibacterales bacterium]|nr:hypothetical protein [Candidatus Palauibacterales bacterium]
MSARKSEARAAAMQPDPQQDAPAEAAHPTWLDRVREAAAPEPDEPLWEPEPVGASDSMWDATDTVEPAPPRAEVSAGAPASEPTKPDPGELPETAAAALEESVGLSVRSLRKAAVEMAIRDAEANLPEAQGKGRAESEEELRDRAVALFRNWQARERARLNTLVSELEGRITRILAGISLDTDRFERVTGELFRLQRRWDMNRSQVESTLEEETGEEEERPAVRQFKTRWYALAIGFLGIVEFLANAPVFGALLPRDPLTEQQLRYVAETSEGWLAGALRVASQFILRPDAALLAAGVVTFLCVLAHFFGHSLRSLMIHQSSRRSGETLGKRSAGEFVVPMILAGIGLTLVIGVLFEARVTLGEVAEDRFAQDSAKIEELRRTASWLRVDGNLVAANEQANRADDLEALAKEQREYAASMSGLSFPILLLNTTLILVAISAAYFHMRDRRRDRFNDTPFERQRRELVDLGDATQQRVADAMGEAVRTIRNLAGLLSETPLREAPALASQLEATVVAYRAENGRLRGLDTREIQAFAEPVELKLVVEERDMRDLLMRDPDDYESERRDLQERFEKIRTRFTEEATAW